jgi:hypothetical protein
VPISYTGGTDGVPVGAYVFVAAVILGVVFAPPAVSLFLRRRRGGG